MVGPSSGSSWQCYTIIYSFIYAWNQCTTKLSMLFQVLGLWLLVESTLEKILFLDLGLTVTEINKYTETHRYVGGWHAKKYAKQGSDDA